MSALDVLSLDAAKAHLNIRLTDIRNDGEITEMIAAAVERVERHLYGMDPVTKKPLGQLDPATATPSQRLACKVVLAEYWRTQKPAGAVRALGTVAQEADDDPAGTAPLRYKLVELLGEPSRATPDQAVPVGSFPAASPWPDPASWR